MCHDAELGEPSLDIPGDPSRKQDAIDALNIFKSRLGDHGDQFAPIIGLNGLDPPLTPEPGTENDRSQFVVL